MLQTWDHISILPQHNGSFEHLAMLGFHINNIWGANMKDSKVSWCPLRAPVKDVISLIGNLLQWLRLVFKQPARCLSERVKLVVKQICAPLLPPWLLALSSSEITPLRSPPSPTGAPLGSSHDWTTLKWVWCCCQTLQCAEHPSSGPSIFTQQSARSKKLEPQLFSIKQLSHFSKRIIIIITELIYKYRCFSFQCCWKTWDGRVSPHCCSSSALLPRPVSSSNQLRVN